MKMRVTKRLYLFGILFFLSLFRTVTSVPWIYWMSPTSSTILAKLWMWRISQFPQCCCRKVGKRMVDHFRERERDRQTDRQADRQTVRERETERDREKERESEKETD